jgi:RHS repeat-associated protein
MRHDHILVFLATDHLGTVSVVLDAAGNVVDESRHYPYGQERWPEGGTFPTDYRFTGQRLDASSGLYHMGARWYDGSLGRWLSADSIVPNPGNPQGFNRLSYAYNNPMRFVDPSGHFTEEELISWGAYTAGELKWLAEHQADWFDYLMQAALGDAFAFAHAGAAGVGQFLMSDSSTLTIEGLSWSSQPGLHAGRGSVREWGDLVGEADVHTWFTEPEGRVFSKIPNPHVRLSGQAAETNAWIVLGVDAVADSLTIAGWEFVALDTLACPMDPAGKLFGYFVANVGSAVSTLSWLDTLVTRGPNSRGFLLNTVTYAAGWSSLVPGIPGTPIDLAAAAVQTVYDSFTLRRIQQQNGR